MLLLLLLCSPLLGFVDMETLILIALSSVYQDAPIHLGAERHQHSALPSPSFMLSPWMCAVIHAGTELSSTVCKSPKPCLHRYCNGRP